MGLPLQVKLVKLYSCYHPAGDRGTDHCTIVDDCFSSDFDPLVDCCPCVAWSDKHVIVQAVYVEVSTE